MYTRISDGKYANLFVKRNTTTIRYVHRVSCRHDVSGLVIFCPLRTPHSLSPRGCFSLIFILFYRIVKE